MSGKLQAIRTIDGRFLKYCGRERCGQKILMDRIGGQPFGPYSWDGGEPVIPPDVIQVNGLIVFCSYRCLAMWAGTIESERRAEQRERERHDAELREAWGRYHGEGEPSRDFIAGWSARGIARIR